jgi:hypothetical protein
MTTYWFRPKRYGYGATPITWEGWALTLATVAVITTAVVFLTTKTALDPAFWIAVTVAFAAIAALITISRAKTDGEWRWRWGDR